MSALSDYSEYAVSSATSDDKEDWLDEDGRQSQNKPNPLTGYKEKTKFEESDEVALEDDLIHRRRRGGGDYAPEQALFGDTVNSTPRNKGIQGAWSAVRTYLLMAGIIFAVLAVR